MFSPAPVIQTVFSKNKVAKNTAVAKKIAAKKERASMGRVKYESDRASRANDWKITNWYEDQEKSADKGEKHAANKRRYIEACIQLSTCVPGYNSNYQRLRILWGRDGKLTVEAYNKLKAQDEKRTERAELRHRLAQFSTPPFPTNDPA